jgi:hypothetical protein
MHIQSRAPCRCPGARGADRFFGFALTTSPVKPVWVDLWVDLWVDRRRHVVMPTMAGRLAELSSRSVLDVMLKLTSSPEDCLWPA